MNPQTITAKDGTKLDASVANLARAMRTVESGNKYDAKGASGEYGAYQWMPGNYEAAATKYGIDPKDRSPINQDKVAYNTIKEWKDQGLTPAQIASKWNSGGTEWEGKVGTNKQGVKYDVPAYVEKVVNTFRAVKAGQEPVDYAKPQPGGPDEAQVEAGANQPVPEAKEGYKPWFESNADDGAIETGFKAAGNMIPSAFNFAKGAISALNPINTIKNLAAIPGEFGALVKESGGVGNALGAFAGQVPKAAYETVVPKGVREAVSGDFGAAGKTFTEDPFGQAAPLVIAAKFGAKGYDTIKSKAATSSYVKNIEANTQAGIPIPKVSHAAEGAFDAGVSKVAQAAMKPASYVFGKAKTVASAPIKYAVAKTSGLDPATISEVARNPKKFTPQEMANTTRGSLGQEVGSALKERRTAVSETSKEYAPIRASKARVKVDPTYVDKSIAETTGLKVVKGQLKPSGSSSIRDGGDIRALQNLYDLWKPEFKKGYLTAEEALNFRSDLGKMAKYGRELTSSKPLTDLASVMRGKFNTTYRGKIAGLEALDKRFAPIRQDLSRLGKDFIDPKTGELKDAAINRIANATGKGKDALLSRLEEIAPGITQKIQTLKAVEDIQNIHKVGTYTKAGAELAGLGAGLVTGNLALLAGSLVAMLFTNPRGAVRIIRTYGNSKALAGAVLEKLNKAGSSINQLPELGQVSVFGRPQQLSAPAE